MNAYQWYLQISLAKKDQDKVSFIVLEDTLYYTVMPFELKNIGTTYQRLMDMVFTEEWGCNI